MSRNFGLSSVTARPTLGAQPSNGPHYAQNTPRDPLILFPPDTFTEFRPEFERCNFTESMRKVERALFVILGAIALVCGLSLIF